MFLPLKDDNPLEIIPFQYVTITFIVTCVAVFIYQVTLGDVAGYEFVLDAGFVPARFFSADEYCGIEEFSANCDMPWAASAFSSMFMHGSWMHLGGNMLFLWIYGDNIEDSMGHGKFIVFYILCGLIATFIHGIADTDSIIPTVGASGAIAGILGAYLVLHPKVKILSIVIIKTVQIPAMFVLGLWLAMQVWGALSTSAEGGGVAWWAHLGGFAAGALLIPLFKNKDIPLFDRGRYSGPAPTKARVKL